MALTVLTLPFLVLPAGGAAKLPVVPKWHRFDQAFKSSVAYTNPLQEVTLTVRFVSPLGETFSVTGFWDGGRTWRVRFAPDQPGEWHFQTSCSDAANRTLHDQSGAFLCTAALGPSRFEQHGPVRVSRHHDHLEHADGTPFFWLADSVWNGALASEPKEWDVYAQVRAVQGFTVAQLTAAPGEDFRSESALTGFPDQIGVNPEVFRRLDTKLELLSHAGMLSAIVPLLEMQTNALSLRDDQAALLVQYTVARWGADPVVWLFPLDAAETGMAAGRWKSIGRSAFRESRHAPVVVVAGRDASVLSQFRDESWLDVFGFRATEDSMRQAFSGSLTSLWANDPVRPILAFTPYENAPAPQSQQRFSADDVRHTAYWGLLTAPPAGVSYGGQGVVNWDQTAETGQDKTPGADFPLWHKAMFMPAAKQMGRLSKFVSALDFWRLRPNPKAIAVQPGDSNPSRRIMAVATDEKDLLLVYVPQDRTLELYLDAMPNSPTVTWFNPRTGENSPAVAVVVGRTCQFPTPEPGDWVLVLRAGK